MSSKEKIKSIFTPDLLLVLFIFFIGLYFTNEVPNWFDLAQSDDNDYIFAGIHFFDASNEIQADWSPLYSFLFFLLHKLIPNPTKIYYLGMQSVGVLLPTFSYLFLRRAQLTRWFAAGTAIFLLASYALWIPEPRVAAFAALVFIFISWIASFFKKRWQRLWVLAIASLFFAYSRPEFFLVTLFLGIVAFSYFFFSLTKRGLQLEKKDFRFLGISSSIALIFLLWWGIPFSDSRTIYAFGQHYADNVQHCIAENTLPNMAWEEILARDFNNAKNMVEVIEANPLNFRRHLFCNIQAFPKSFLKVSFSSAWGSSWFIIRIWAALILHRIIVQGQELKKRLLWLWEKDFLLLPILSLGVLAIDISLIYPREHYLVLTSIIVWLLGSLLFGNTFKKKEKEWLKSITIGSILFFLMPSMGTLFDFNIPQKPVHQTVETIRNLELNEPLRLFASQPFQPSRSEVYFSNDDYTPIKYKPANVAFDEYISTHQPNIIVITKSGWHFKDDESWLSFQQNPQIIGYKKLPFESEDQFGVWWIYQQE